MKMHVNFSAADLDRSVSFYRALLDAAPVKYYGDYALFITEEPALELALHAAPDAVLDDSVHYGVVVNDANAVEQAVQRLQSAGLPTEVEREETCCYALQTKVWTNDPDGRRWEVYTVHEESETADDASVTCCP